MSRQRKEPLSWQEEPPQASQGDRAASPERGRDDNAQRSHGSVWTPLPRCKLLTSHCVLAWWKEGALWDPFNQGTSLPFVGGPLLTPSPPSTVTLRGRVSTQDLGGHEPSVSRPWRLWSVAAAAAGDGTRGSGPLWVKLGVSPQVNHWKTYYDKIQKYPLFFIN